MKTVPVFTSLLVFGLLACAVPIVRSVVLCDTPPVTDISTPALATSTGSQWLVECVDCPKAFAPLTDHSLRLDADGHPHVAYGGDHLYYSWHDGTQWLDVTVDAASGAGRAASLALDEWNFPHIGYLGDGAVKYAAYDGATWYVDTVDSGQDFGQALSLALDSHGRPHVSYSSSGALKYAWHDGATWHVETVNHTGSFPSLMLDASDRPHISFATGTLKYAWHDGTTWHIEDVDSGGWVRWATSLALDSAGHPHIGYYLPNDDPYNEWTIFKYAWFDGATWQRVAIGGAGEEGGYTSLALDSLDRPHMVWSYSAVPHALNGILRYTRFDETGWHTEDIALLRDHVSVSLALDGSDRAHVIYIGSETVWDYATGALWYTWNDGEQWRAEIVDHQDKVGSHTSMALDSQGWAHISYYDEFYGGLKYARQNETGWQIETVDSQDWAGQQTDLALDGANRAHISYVVPVYNDLKHAWHDGTDWHVETVDGESVTQYPSLALDSTGRPHISYVGDGALKYAWLDGATWLTETVSIHADGYAHTSLALDELNHPHIAFNADEALVADPGLRYAWHDGAAWHIETVDTSIHSHHISLVLDAAGRPHVAYNTCKDWGDWAHNRLRYAWLDGTIWHTETVSSDVFGFSYLSLDLDGMDRPYLGFYDDINADLKYAWRDGATWQVGSVDSAGDVGQYASLALDERDRPHISYFDSSNSDLKYARLLPPLLLDKQAAPTDGLRNNETLTYTLTLSGPGLDVRLWDPLPSGVYYITASLTGTLSPSAVYSSTAHAVYWEGTLPTATAGMVQFQVTPGLSGTVALSPSLPIVNRAWLTDTVYSRMVSATFIVNSRCVYLPLTLREH